jgi:hypothetical protein
MQLKLAILLLTLCLLSSSLPLQIVLLGVCISSSPSGGDQYEQLSLQPMPYSPKSVRSCFAAAYVLSSMQIVLLGVCISSSPSGGDQYEQLSLQPMPLYSLPTDNVIMTCFASSAGGRLFMGGADGNLYEIQYEATDRWLKRRCTKVRVGGGTTRWQFNICVRSASFCS